ncbi:RNA binding S1 domain protein [Rhodopirellula maiorica SM1]|uniref:RNA binding S1 domain protein n=1 Tax=Rhodopirellula maiorica SM1 TaxID=1265738 RepID=M5RRE6_9BACT|nr:Tex-like N-terminal domain-containing protein [Rhodopirellula maiorica]EMI17962.1 RNA binding S1 domain protein [Rhodopirellula maiorica SM1]
MTVDLEAIARRGRCEESSLRIALPLIEQGYSPPFLARYRRDELGGLDEASLWALAEALQADRQLAARRAELLESWRATPIADPALGRAIEKANSKRMLERLGRRIKLESSEAVDSATRLAVRVLNPQKGDGDDLHAIAEKMETIDDANEASAKLEKSLAGRLAGDPRMINAAVQWLGKNAKIHVIEIHDPHSSADHDHDDAGDKAAKPGSTKSKKSKSTKSVDAKPAAKDDAAKDEAALTKVAEESATESTPAAEAASDEKPVAETAAIETPATESAAADSTSEAATTADAAKAEEAAAATETPAATETTAATETPATTETATSEAVATEPAAEKTAGDAAATESATEAPATEAAKPADADSAAAATGDKPAADAADAKAKEPKAEKKSEPAPAKKQKKVSPRQRRRRWLMSVLKPLEGKRIPTNKLSSFQTVMLARALRSQVANCSFEYDANRLVAELQSTAERINPRLADMLRSILIENEADIRGAAEAAWWDELQERASTRLLGIAADHLRMQVNRSGVEAKVVMSIDAVGPRTAATAIVASDGRLLHCEDLPCQLSAGMRSQAVLRMGELIHAHHVDLIVISNGPARRGCLVAVSELVKQSPENSVRWTLADRSGADTYAGSQVADQEMRTTPRRFRSAAWVAFSVLQPAGAIAKVDPLKLRLGSFQRELSDQALMDVLDDVMVSGASRGGVDANAAPTSWLCRLPGVTPQVADALDSARRKELFKSREQIEELDAWGDQASTRQALPFLRVFGSEETLDGTLVHPEDYPLAKKLATALEIELPPSTPPGYETPNFDEDALPKLSDVVEPVAESEDKPSEEAAEEKPFGLTAELDTANSGDDAAATDASTESGTEATAPAEAAEGSDATAGSENSDADSSAGDAAASESADSPAAEAAAEADATSESDAAKPAEEAAVSMRVVRPRPEKAKIDKCIKEWQIGARRARQLVSWLCDPFGDSDVADGASNAVLTSMPNLKTLKTGDQVIGVVVGVMPFGVFVELAPDCSGLIHVSRVSEQFIEDLHEAIQVGDVITTWVTGIDTKRRRVALSAISPQREIELEEMRRQRNERPHRGQHSQNRGGGNRGGGNREGGGARGGAAAGGGQAAKGGRPDNRGGRGKAGAAGGGGRPGGGGQRGGRDGGRGRDNRGRDNRGGGRGKHSETYRVVSNKPVEPISDAMLKGDEPLRSFGDLMQFVSKDKAEPAKEVKPKQEKVKPEASAVAETSEAATTAAEKTADAAAEPVKAESPKSELPKPESTEASPTTSGDEPKSTSTEPSA